MTLTLVCVRMVRPEDNVEFLASSDDESDSEVEDEDDPDSNGDFTCPLLLNWYNNPSFQTRIILGMITQMLARARVIVMPRIGCMEPVDAVSSDLISVAM